MSNEYPPFLAFPVSVTAAPLVDDATPRQKEKGSRITACDGVPSCLDVTISQKILNENCAEQSTVAGWTNSQRVQIWIGITFVAWFPTEVLRDVLYKCSQW